MPEKSRTALCLELAPQLPVDRPRTGAADEDEEGNHKDEDREFAAAGRPEEASRLGREVHAVDHEDDDRKRGGTGEESEHKENPADQLGATDQRAPEEARGVADLVEQRGVLLQAQT